MALELGSASGALGAGLGIASAAVVTLYLLKVRRRRQAVVFLKLWQQVLADSQRTAWWRNLRRLLSLLLQIVLLALLFGALARPRRAVDETDRTIVLVLDRSASMSTADLDAQTRFAAARQAALALLLRLGPRDRATVVLADHHPRALGPIGTEPSELRRLLSTVEPGQTALDVAATLRLSADLLLGQPNPTIALFTDGAFEFPSDVHWKTAPPGDAPSAIDLRGVALSVELFGKQRGNVGITAFQARRYRTNLTAYEVLLEVGSSFAETKAVEIELLLDGQTVAVDTLVVEAGGRAQKIYTNLAGHGAELEARIKRPLDALPVDDQAFAVLPRPRPLRILLVTAGNLFVEGALLLDPTLKVQKIAPTGWRDDLAKEVDAIVFDRFLPERLPSTAALILGAPVAASASPFVSKREQKTPIVTELDRKHPLMKWIDLKDLNIASSVVFEPASGDVVLARALRDPIVVAGTRGKHRYVAIGFDVQKSDWPLRVSFPVFVTNVLGWFTETSEAPDLALRLGVPRRVQLDGSAGAVQVTLPGQPPRQTTIRDGRLQLVAETRGFVELRLADQRTLTLPASLLDPEESLRPMATSLQLDGQPIGGPLEGRSGLPVELWPLFVLLALGLAAIEWWTYHRRVTV